MGGGYAVYRLKAGNIIAVKGELRADGAYLYEISVSGERIMSYSPVLSPLDTLLSCTIGIVLLILNVFCAVAARDELMRVAVDGKNYDSDHATYTEDYFGRGKRYIAKGDGSGVEGEYSDRDAEVVSFKIKRFYGVYILNAYRGNGRALTLHIASQIKSGELGIEITDRQNRRISVVADVLNSSVTMLARRGQTYYVKCVGHDATISVTLRRTE